MSIEVRGPGIDRNVLSYERAEVIEMRVQHPVIHTSRHWQVSALALACAFSASACSAEYPIGNLEDRAQLVEVEASGAAAVVVRDNTPGLLELADVTFQLGDWLSRFTPVVPVGDLDGDGFGDTMVVNDDLFAQLTTVHLLYGGPRPSGGGLLAFDEQGPRLVLDEASSLGGSSLAISAAGDVDGDGFGDVLLRTVECEPTQSGEGAYLLYGGAERLEGSPALGSAAVQFVPPELGSRQPGLGCGGSNSPTLGDLDGDGFADFMLQVSPRGLLESASDTYLFYGRAERFASGTAFTSADALLQTTSFAGVTPVNDVDGDGRADLLMGHTNPIFPGEHTFFLPGSGQRLAGVVDIEARAIPLAALLSPGSVEQGGGSDIDGDGLSDVLLKDDSGVDYLFYGALGLFADGLDFALGVPFSAGSNPIWAGDRDGDGKTDLLNPSYVEGRLLDVAVLSGRAERFSGTIRFPGLDIVPARELFEGDPERVLELAFPAGDLDGDGASDVFSVSTRHVFDDMPGFQTRDGQLHVHYGRPAPVLAPRLR